MKKIEKTPKYFNRKAKYDYQVLDVYQAGISLTGPETRSARDGGVDLHGAFCTFDDKGLVLVNSRFSHTGNSVQFNELRPKRLLLKKKELKHFQNELKIKGISIIPLEAYFRNGLLKLAIGICKGKKEWDKRQAIRERDEKRNLKQV
jgi:SsrA-binding protein